MVMVYGTTNAPQNDIGNYLGRCSKGLGVTGFRLCASPDAKKRGKVRGP